ncbi:MAG TPA: hypothetical protein VKV80_07400 [Streptosporangiaceae bacterium]|nr:hypothetical protein [Streptosporangiaceae bacterium]
MGKWWVCRAAAMLSAAAAGGSLAAVLAAGTASAQTTAHAPAPAPGTTPAVAVQQDQVFVFYRAANGSVSMTDVTTGKTTSAGGRLLSAPSAVPDGGGLLVFGRGTDNQLWDTYCTTGGSCEPWGSLGGNLTSRPGAVLVGSDSDYLSVYVRGTDGAVWARDFGSPDWDAWHRVGGQVLGGTGPAAAAIGGSTYVMVAGTNRELYLEKVGVTGFNPVGGVTTANPALTAVPGALVGFARGTDNAGYYHRFLSSSPGWHPIGGTLASGLAASSPPGTARTYTFGLGTDSQAYEDVGNWSGYPPAFGGWFKVTG